MEAFTLAPGERALIGTGVAVAIPPGMCGLVLPRSGLAIKHGIACVNAPGLIDPNYRGEIGVILINHGSEPFERAGRGPDRAAARHRRSPRRRSPSWMSCRTATAARAASAPAGADQSLGWPLSA